MKKAIDNYKAVFLDAGDTLITIPAAQQVIGEFFLQRSIQGDEHRINVVLKEAINKFYYKKSLDQAALSSPDIDRTFWVELYTYMLQKLDVHLLYDARQIHRWCHELYDIFVAPDIYELFDDVKETLEALQSRGLKLAIVSNFAETLKQILKDKGIAHYFEAIIVSTEVGIEKPNPEIFRLALNNTNLKPNEVVYVGDHEINDIWSPNQVGMDAIRIIRYEYQQNKRGIHSLSELLHSPLPIQRKDNS